MGNFTGFQKSSDYYIHPRLGQIKRIQKQNGPQLFEYKVLVQSQDIFEQWQKIIEKLTTSICNTIIFLPISYYFQKIGYCGQNGQVFLLFDGYMFCLKDEIKNRSAIQRSFPQTFIWQILYKMVKIELFMKKNYKTIGSICSDNIIANEEGDLRIVSQYSWPGLENSLFDIEQSQKKIYSPEQYTFLIKINTLIKKQQPINHNENNKKKILNHIQEKYDKNLAQVFCIGVLLLEILTLKDCQVIYGQERINQNIIFQRIISLREKYSNALIHIIWQMLKMNPGQRITAEEIDNILAPFEGEIMSNHKFTLIHQYFNNPIYINSQGQLVTVPQSKLIQKHEKNKWSCFGNLFPFLRPIPQNQQNIIMNQSIHRRGTDHTHSIQLATAR